MNQLELMINNRLHYMILCTANRRNEVTYRGSIQALNNILKFYIYIPVITALISIAVLVAPTAHADTRQYTSWNTWIVAPDTAFPAPASTDNPSLAYSRKPAVETVTRRNWLAKWGQRPATMPWTDLTLDLIVKYQLNPLRAARHLAYVHTAMYDAHLLAAKAGYDERARRVAVDSAAAAILEYLFPQEPVGRFGALGRSAAWAVTAHSATGKHRSQNHAWQIGQQVANLAADRARKDRADLVWDIRRRPAAAPGIWKATPPLNVYKPAEPRAGEWRTWLLRDGAELAPPPPITFDSPEYWKEVEEVLKVTEQLTPQQKKIAEDWNLGHATVTPAGVWNLHALRVAKRHNLDSAQTARLFAALNTAMMDAFIACWNAKFNYWTQRPVTAIRARLKPDFLPHLVTPPFPSYVSGHATVSGAASEVLAGFFPEQAETFRTMAEEAAQSRLYGGIHFSSDNREGLRLGQQIGHRMIGHLGMAQKTPSLAVFP